MKPGYRTSEFWMNMIAIFMTSGMGMDPAMVDSGMAFTPVVISGIYTIGRSIVKWAWGGSE